MGNRERVGYSEPRSVELQTQYEFFKIALGAMCNSYLSDRELFTIQSISVRYNEEASLYCVHIHLVGINKTKKLIKFTLNKMQYIFLRERVKPWQEE